METTLTTPQTLKNYDYPTANYLALVVLNDYNFYVHIENLGLSLRKIYKKCGGLDLPRLEHSSTLKVITRAARKYCRNEYGDSYTMDDDMAARKNLTYYLAEFAFFSF